jgi:LmbE family N-acetylglucosaminyl deacetylase
MPKALAIVAHHDDHILWMGGTIQRMITKKWHWTLIAMCVPAPEKREYFQHCCSIFGAIPIVFEFNDYPNGDAFSQNDRNKMRSELIAAVCRQQFDFIFTHSRSSSGEYWFKHPNHDEVRDLVTELAQQGKFGLNCQSPAFFSYDVIYKGGTATCARCDANFYMPLTYSELLWKCQLCRLAPDVDSNLKNLAFPCPNPEAFEGDNLHLPQPFVLRQS